MTSGHLLPASRFDAARRLFQKARLPLLWIGLSLLSLAAAALFLWATSPHGIGMTTDSVDYVWTARSLASGLGLGTLDGLGRFKPATVEPPLYPLMLSLFQRAGVDALQGARWLGAVSIALVFLLYGLLIHRLTRRSFWFPLLGTLALFFLADSWTTSLYAMTEPTYLIFTLTGLLCLDDYDRQGRKRNLVGAALLFALASLDRYVGLAVIAAALAFLLVRRGPTARRRLQDLLWMGALSLLPMLAWLARNLLLARTATSYVARFVPITAAEWNEFFQTLAGWVRPIYAFRFTPLALGLGLVTCGTAYLLLRQDRAADPAAPAPTRLPLLLGIYAVCYLAFIIASRWIAVPLVTFYQVRLVYPMASVLFCLALGGLALLRQKVAVRFGALGAALLAAVLVLLTWSYVVTDRVATRPYIQPILVSRYNGLGLQNTAFPSWDFLAELRQLPKDAVLFTDDTQRMYFFTGRPAFFVGADDPGSLALLRETLASRQVAVGLFSSADTQALLSAQFPGLTPAYASGSSSVFLEK